MKSEYQIRERIAETIRHYDEAKRLHLELAAELHCKLQEELAWVLRDDPPAPSPDAARCEKVGSE